MPLYEYYCADCHDRFEVLSSYEAAESGRTVCATCHSANVRKLLSVVAKRGHGDADDFGDMGDFGDDDGGSCGCGGACSCGN
jgi:putative FmdB family regulatory protein